MWISYVVTFLIISGISLTQDAPTPHFGHAVPQIEPEEEVESEAAREEALRKFFEEWTVYMKGFDPSDMLNFELKAGSKISFFLTAETAPQIIRAAYSVSAKTKNKVTLTLFDPSWNPILIKDKQREGIIYVQVNTTGEYHVVIANNNVRKIVIFT
jgi:hypothetical protein